MEQPGASIRTVAALFVLGTGALLSGCGTPSADSAATYADVAPTAFELDGPGTNVDDPCFWYDQANPASSLLFVTTKDSGLVEVFNASTGAFVTSIRGFGRPNNCAVEGDLLLTTDREPDAPGAVPGKIKVHSLPDLKLLRTFGEDTEEPHGIDVLTLPGGERRVYVTDKPDASVHVYDLASGDLIQVFSTGFGDGIEPVLVDDQYRRIYVARGEKEKRRGIGLFDVTGKLQREFGAEVFTKDVEGMAIYACGDGGYLLAADQHRQKAQFEIFDRVSLQHLGTFRIHDGDGEFSSATDGIDVLQEPLPGFPSGLLAVCDGCGSNEPDEMDVVSWDVVASVMGLERCPGGQRAQ